MNTFKRHSKVPHAFSLHRETGSRGRQMSEGLRPACCRYHISSQPWLLTEIVSKRQTDKDQVLALGLFVFHLANKQASKSLKLFFFSFSTQQNVLRTSYVLNIRKYGICPYAISGGHSMVSVFLWWQPCLVLVRLPKQMLFSF